MIAAGHTAVGVIIGVSAYHFLGQSDPISGLIITGTAGVTAHYLGDFIPHGHFFKPGKFKQYVKPVIIFDLLLPIALFLGIAFFKNGFNEKLLYLMFGIGGSQLPDVVSGLVMMGKIKSRGLLKAESDFHDVLHWHGRGLQALLLGPLDLWQILTILIALFLVIFN